MMGKSNIVGLAHHCLIGWGRAPHRASGRVLRCSPTCPGLRSRGCGGFLRSPPRSTRPQGHACAGLPLRPLTRNTGCDPAVRRVVVDLDDLGLMAATPPGSCADHPTTRWSWPRRGHGH